MCWPLSVLLLAITIIIMKWDRIYDSYQGRRISWSNDMTVWHVWWKRNLNDVIIVVIICVIVTIIVYLFDYVP